jgi:16S rRNA (guanine527-N7)-methyltransferase
VAGSDAAAVNSAEFQERLIRRARLAGVTVQVDLGAKLEVYYRLLATWNRKINLTGMDLTDPTPEALDRLLIEPIVAAKQASSSDVRLIDIGSGGGSPAIPFALAIPHARLLMVESKARKSVFLKEATRVLEMDNSVLTSRYESLLARPLLHEAHDVLTIRAVRADGSALWALQTFVRPGGRLFLFRSTAAADHGADASMPAPLRQIAAIPLVESLQSELIILSKHAEP